jgi:hypothetical protein
MYNIYTSRCKMTCKIYWNWFLTRLEEMQCPKFTKIVLCFPFQVFVANPNKSKPILDILLRNQDKLVDFLTKFHTDRSEDDQFNDEKAYLIKQIRELRPIKE